MAVHSKWANIKHRKGAQDAKRGKIFAKLIKEIGGARVLGPFLVNMERPVQIVPMTASAGDLVTTAVLSSTGVVM